MLKITYSSDSSNFVKHFSIVNKGNNVNSVDCGERYLLENYERYCQFNYGTICLEGELRVTLHWLFAGNNCVCVGGGEGDNRYFYCFYSLFCFFIEGGNKVLGGQK